LSGTSSDNIIKPAMHTSMEYRLILTCTCFGIRYPVKSHKEENDKSNIEIGTKPSYPTYACNTAQAKKRGGRMNKRKTDYM
jgi:hypothetical protein